jgi:cell pole-organizing protein PopZ
MNFSNINPDEEMSMEDILSSIRKYVSEEDEKRESTLSNPEKDYREEQVIKLQEENVISNHEPVRKTEPVFSYPETPAEPAKVAEKPIRKSNPFGQLTEALNSYGKAKPKQEAKSDTFAPTINEFFLSVTERIIEKWVKENLQGIVEQIVVREIEKMKSED